MSYYTGTASSFADLATALKAHAVTDGWVLSGNVLSKAGVFFSITAEVEYVSCMGCESNALLNPAPAPVSIGKLWEGAGTTRIISFPCTYHVFGFAQELFFVVNYDVSKYQWMAFGKSTVPGLPGQGGWFGASIGDFRASGESFYGSDYVVAISPTTGGASYSTTCPALFWATQTDHTAEKAAWVNHGLDGIGWNWNAGNGTQIGISAIVPLIGMQPSEWNSEPVLLPIRAWKERPDYKISLIVDVENARYIRIDNLAPGDILTIGSDKWKVFPWYIKNSAERNGPVDYSGRVPAELDHTGTFGWAIRYEGP